MKNNLISAAALFFALIFVFESFAIASPYGIKHYLFQADLNASWFNSIGNYDSGSKATALPGANQFSENKYVLGLNYDWTDSWGTFLKLSYARNSSSDSVTQRASSGISDLVVGGDFAFRAWVLNIVPEFSLGIPFSAVTSGTDDVLLGDGATFFQGRLSLSHNFRFMDLMGYTGIKYRTRSLSSLFLLGAEARKETEDFILSAGVHMYSSVIKDSTTSEVDRNAINARVDGGSLIYNARDPSLLWVAANAAWRLEPNIAIGGGIEQSLSGTNAPYGTKFLFTLAFSDFIGGGRKKLGQAKGSRYFLNSDKQNEANDVEYRKTKKFRADDKPVTEEPVPAEPFDVQIRRAKPPKKK